MNENEFELVEDSGQVFRDFGDSDADPKQAGSIIAARIITVPDEAELAVRKAKDTTGFAASDFSSFHPAKQGGLSSIVSSVTLYNEIARRRPDLAATLSEPLPFDRRGEVPENEKPFFLSAVFSHHDGLVSSYATRRYIESSQRHRDAPRLTPQHYEGLDLLDMLAEDPEFHLDMEFAPGDIQFLNNHTEPDGEHACTPLDQVQGRHV